MGCRRYLQAPLGSWVRPALGEAGILFSPLERDAGFSLLYPASLKGSSTSNLLEGKMIANKTKINLEMSVGVSWEDEFKAHLVQRGCGPKTVAAYSQDVRRFAA